jgi:hypothetical protein
MKRVQVIGKSKQDAKEKGKAWLASKEGIRVLSKTTRPIAEYVTPAEPHGKLTGTADWEMVIEYEDGSAPKAFKLR